MPADDQRVDRPDREKEWGEVHQKLADIDKQLKRRHGPPWLPWVLAAVIGFGVGGADIVAGNFTQRHDLNPPITLVAPAPQTSPYQQSNSPTTLVVPAPQSPYQQSNFPTTLVAPAPQSPYLQSFTYRDNNPIPQTSSGFDEILKSKVVEHGMAHAAEGLVAVGIEQLIIKIKEKSPGNKQNDEYLDCLQRIKDRIMLQLEAAVQLRGSSSPFDPEQIRRQIDIDEEECARKHLNTTSPLIPRP